jgi:hypothetical protein
MSATIGQRLDVLNRLLAFSAEDTALGEKLGRALDTILTVSWLPIEPRGCIMVAEDDRVLRMAAHRGMDAGRTAATRQGERSDGA